MILPTSTLVHQKSVAHRNVAVTGSSGGIVQPQFKDLKLNPALTKFALYNIVHTPRVAADLSLNKSIAEVIGSKVPVQIEASLKDCEIVVKPRMTRDDLFNTNTSIAAKPYKRTLLSRKWDLREKG